MRAPYLLPIALLCACSTPAVMTADGAPDHAVYVPVDHRPPAGVCRVWYPALPPGEQPPPGNCAHLRALMPRGTVLVRG